MSRFVAGFAVASVLWGVAFYLYESRDGETVDETAVALDVADAAAGAAEGEKGRGGGGSGRRRAGAQPRDPELPRGEATTGDDLDEDAVRVLEAGEEGGEEQLSSAQIEESMGAAFGSLRRCLVLSAGDEPVIGTVTIGLRIAGDGSVRAVNLNGPAAVTTGESGQCLRSAVRRVRFPTFDGPEMVVRYPIVLE